MTTITASFPDGDQLVWTDGTVTAPRATYKSVRLREMTGSVEGAGEYWVEAESWPTDPYAFIGICRRLGDESYGPPSIESDSALPPLPSGGLVTEPEA